MHYQAQRDPALQGPAAEYINRCQTPIRHTLMFSKSFVAAGLFSIAAAFSNSTNSTEGGNGTTYTTVVTAYTTYCPYPTTFTEGNKTYTVTEATTLTITDCPCTITTTGTKPPKETATGVPSESPSVPENNAVAKAFGVAAPALAIAAALL